MKKEITITSQKTLRDKIYVIRDMQVMLDCDLADMYGYELKKLNQQVRRNIERFPEDFMFQLSKDEFDNLKSHFVTSSWGGIRKLPYAFTEQGIYQLATVLKGEFAIKQSINIMRVFRTMREYIMQNNVILPQHNLLQLIKKQTSLETEVREIKTTMVSKTDLSDVMKLFDNNIQNEEILILNGQPFKADLAYQNIYKKAKKNIIVIDDYIGIKTLQHLTYANHNIDITIISNNKSHNPLLLDEYNDFLL